MELPKGMSCWSSGKWSEMMMLSGLARRRDKSRRCHYLTAGEAARVGVAACAWAGAVGGVPGGAATRAAGVVAVLARGGRVPVARVGVGSAHGVDDPADAAALLHNHRGDLVVLLAVLHDDRVLVRLGQRERSLGEARLVEGRAGRTQPVLIPARVRGRELPAGAGDGATLPCTEQRAS